MVKGSPIKSARKRQSTPGEDRRMQQTATWTRSLTHETKEWGSEQREALQADVPYPKHFFFLDKMKEKKTYVQKKENSMLLDDAIAKLQYLAISKYGDVATFFRMFDADGDGVITLDEFSKAVKRRNLERSFPRREQRIIFDTIDADDDGHISLTEFRDILQKSSKYLNPLDHSPVRGGVKPLVPCSQPVDPSVEFIKEQIIEKLTQKLRSSKEADNIENKTIFLLNAFRQIDTDMSGTLSRDEINSALGPAYLNINTDAEKLDKVFNAMDVNKDGHVSYREFINFLAVHDIDPEYDPFYDGRRANLRQLEKKARKPWEFTKETQEALDHAMEYEALLDADLQAREEARAADQVRTLGGADEDSFLRSRSLPILNDTTSNSAKLFQKSAKLDNYEQVFNEMSRTKQMQMASTCPRIVPPPPTDWTRVGYGGNGTKSESGLFVTPDDRFRTTNSLYFTKLDYRPNFPVSRANMGDAAQSTQTRLRKMAAKNARRTTNMQTIQKRLRAEEAMKKMSLEQSLKFRAATLHRYYETAYQRDEDIAAKLPPENMQKRSAELMARRVWGGSPESPFNFLNKPSTAPVTMTRSGSLLP